MLYMVVVCIYSVLLYRRERERKVFYTSVPLILRHENFDTLYVVVDSSQMTSTR